MNSKNLTSLTCATVAALAFSTLPTTAAFAADTATANVKCFGANACKSQSACKTTTNACKGHNACKGQGVALMASEKACTDAGGKTSEDHKKSS
jgi:hypothetical protein